MPKRTDNVFFLSVRMNVTNPQHVRIAKVLNELNPDFYKSKNQFVIEALEFYIDNYGSEAFTGKKQESDNEYISRKEFDQLKKDLKNEIIVEAKNEIIRALGSIVMAPAAKQPIMLQVPEDSRNGKDTVDEVIAGLVSDWDTMDGSDL